jgi:hypothetical protein
MTLRRFVVSRTRHHSRKYGVPRKEDATDKRAAGYDFMSRRWGNHGGTNFPAKDVKAMTNRAERRIAKHALAKEDCTAYFRLARAWDGEDALAPPDCDKERSWLDWEAYGDAVGARRATAQELAEI